MASTSFEFTDPRLGGEHISDTATALGGQVAMVQYLVVALDANSKLVPFDEDGSTEEKIPHGILIEAVDPLAGDVPAEVWRSGQFDEDLVIFENPSATTPDEVRVACQSAGIYLVNTST